MQAQLQALAKRGVVLQTQVLRVKQINKSCIRLT